MGEKKKGRRGKNEKIAKRKRFGDTNVEKI